MISAPTHAMGMANGRPNTETRPQSGPFRGALERVSRDQRWPIAPLKALLQRNDSGVWGEEADGEGTVVLRSTEITVDGKWNLESPAVR